jgi:N-acetylglucosaminyldiphosphoundecaprenol N-acetyl-beta-D-mannosaminyltransferase
MKKIKILDIAFDVVTKKDALERLIGRAGHERQSYAVTPNPEILLAAQKDSAYRDILNGAALSIPDGIGILWAATFLEKTKRTRSRSLILLKAFFSLAMLIIYPRYCRSIFPQRVTGTDIFVELCTKTEDRTIFLLGAKPGVAEEAAKKLLEKSPKTRIVGTFAGSPSKKYLEEIIEKINDAKPNILFVAYGAPAQEKWIAQNLHRLTSVKLAMGIGGAFDFAAGVRKRAPRWMQKIGMEWLWRLSKEPKRIMRIFNASVKFPWTVVRTRLKN